MGLSVHYKGGLHSLGDLLFGWDAKTYLVASVKTQFAGCAEHIWLIGLLRHVQRTYMPELDVSDEGGFWETGDRKELQQRMNFLDGMIKEFGTVLEQASMDTVIEKNDPDAVADFVEFQLGDFPIVTQPQQRVKQFFRSIHPPNVACLPIQGDEEPLFFL